MKSGK